MQKNLCTTLVLIALLFSAGKLTALQSDRQQPLDATADHFDDNGEGVTVLSGNVEITQGSLLIRANRATVFRENSAIGRVLIVGEPATVHQDLDGSQGPMDATAATIDYDLANNQLTMRGDVQVTQMRGQYSGQVMRYDLVSGKIDGGEGQDRIRLRLDGGASGGDNGQ
ncbi:MAG: hypothetical protein DHS20C11_30840 [Lysobacteraceae bacterium]|nr:MAG: hypothetical protein DHS20C11_30840 [Xanthomonadaceae bacterium]